MKRFALFISVLFVLAFVSAVLAGSISGTVYQSDGITPITGLAIDVQAHQGDPCDWSGYVSSGFTDPNDSTYTIAGLPPGTYNLRTFDDGEGYVNEWWASGESTRDCHGAGVITLGPDDELQGYDFQLDLGGSISGQVTGPDGPIEGLWVHAFDGSCWDTGVGGAYTDEDGNYTISGLPEGEVYVETCAGCDHLNYIDEWWDGAAGTTDCGAAVPVSVTSGTVTEGIDFALEKGPRRLHWFEVAVYDGILEPAFDVLPGFNHLFERATLTGPGGFSYEFDLEDDLFEWLTECSYLIFWAHSFSSEFEYGAYTLTLVFFDGFEERHTVNLEEAHPIPVDSATMSHTVNPDGSIDFHWIPPSQDQYYQVRIYSSDGRIRYYRSGNMVSETSLHVSPGDLRCLERGETYLWQVRTYDDMPTYYAVERGESLPLVYDPDNLTGRTAWIDAESFRGKLGLGFDVRPGSRNHITQATVAGPESFSYMFNLTADWYDISTETRFNRGWWREFDPPFAFGDYTFQIEFSDGHTETLTRRLEDVNVTPVDSVTMEYEVHEDGAITFLWNLPGGVTGQNYNVRVRSIDGTKEYCRSYTVTDGTEVTLSFWDLRALEHGRTYQWFVRANDVNYHTTEQSGSIYFEYNPFALPIALRSSTLGNNPVPSIPDLDIFGFEGMGGETVTIKLAKDAAGFHTGEEATLILKDKIRGGWLFRIDRSALPNQITATLPADGEYLIVVGKQEEGFTGDYCLIMTSSEDAYETLEATFLVE